MEDKQIERKMKKKVTNMKMKLQIYKGVKKRKGLNIY